MCLHNLYDITNYTFKVVAKNDVRPVKIDIFTHYTIFILFFCNCKHIV